MLLGIKERQAALAVQNTELQTVLARQQQLLDTIAELSTPLIPLSQETLLLPLVGHIDEARAARIMDTTLLAVHARRARIVLIDVSAVPVIDPGIVTGLVQLSEAIRLLGARVMLVGIRVEMAQAMVQLDVPFDTLETARDLQGALATINAGPSRRAPPTTSARS